MSKDKVIVHRTKHTSFAFVKGDNLEVIDDQRLADVTGGGWFGDAVGWVARKLNIGIAVGDNNRVAVGNESNVTLGDNSPINK